jgi:hypothetical protein
VAPRLLLRIFVAANVALLAICVYSAAPEYLLK